MSDTVVDYVRTAASTAVMTSLLCRRVLKHESVVCRKRIPMPV